jgi:hypothetical protein
MMATRASTGPCCSMPMGWSSPCRRTRRCGARPNPRGRFVSRVWRQRRNSACRSAPVRWPPASRCRPAAHYRSSAVRVPSQARQQAEKRFGVLKADHAHAFDLLAGAVEKDDSRRAVELETLQQRLVGVRVGSDVGLQQCPAGQFRLHARIGEGETLHFLARDAPVGIKSSITGCPAAAIRLSSSASERTRVNGSGLASLLAALLRSTDSGCSGSREPASVPSSIAAPSSSMTMPIPFQKRCQPLACGGSGSSACR